MNKQKIVEKQLSKELDVLENAISDENNALAICSREEIWNLVYRLIDFAIQEERERIVDIVDDLTWNYKDAGVNELEDNTAYLKVSDLKEKLK